MLEAIQIAEQQFFSGNYQKFGRNAAQVRVRFDTVVGQGYYAKSTQFSETNEVIVRFDLTHNRPFTAFPVLPGR